MEFKVSVVMAAYNSEMFISQAINSVINQSLDFKKHIQLVIVDDASTDNTLKIAEYYSDMYPQNIIVLSNEENRGAAYTRNVGLKYAQGEYINFLDSDDYISEYAFTKVTDFFKRNPKADIVSIPIYFFGNKKGEHKLNFKYNKTQLINLNKNPEYIQLSGASSFFRHSRIKNHKFEENLRVSEDPLFINQILLKNPLIGFVSDCGYYYRKHEVSNSLISSSKYYKSFFTTRFNYYFFRLIRDSIEEHGAVPKFIQYVLMYDLYWLSTIEDVSYILTKEEFLKLHSNILKLLQYIDRDVIINQQLGDNRINIHLLLLKLFKTEYLKDKSNIHDESIINEDALTQIISDLNVNSITVNTFEFKSTDEIRICGVYTTFSANETEIKIIADGREYSTNNHQRQDNYSLNFNYAYNHCFEVTIPVSKVISFKANNRNLQISYAKSSRLSKTSKYYLGKEYIATDCDSYIKIEDKSWGNILKKEFNVVKTMILNHKQGWRTGVLLRILYFLTYPIYNNRRIWIFMDEANRAEDNGVTLFEYAVSNEPHNIDKVFTISKSDVEYNFSNRKGKVQKLLGLDKSNETFDEISKTGYVLPYKSLKHRLYSLFAEAVITSYADNPTVYPSWDNFEYVSGLTRSKTVCLQHGVSTRVTNHCGNNLKLIACASETEKGEFLRNDYDENTVKVLGFPRFDNLKHSESKKELLIIPLWNRHFNNLTVETFMKTNFFNTYNRLLNDDELIRYLDGAGYKIVFKTHPKFNKFLMAFNKHSMVEFTNLSYSEVLNDSSLLITDYSSCAFDFAYLKKPVIYYHFNHNEFQNKTESYFSHDEMGFGPVVKNIEELKKTVISMIENDCVMDDDYQKRVDEFFKYIDGGNSKRVYDALLEMDFYY